MSNICETGGGEYFAAANTGCGFVSYFDELFFCDGIKRRYIIKGGPGTGKSSLMRRVAEYAKTLGREVTLYYCSSDTSSLDGVVIDGAIAIFDGTSPHSYDTVLPGACDELINLGAFWNAEGLVDNADILERYSCAKKTAYSNAYGYLKAAAVTEAVLDSITLECVVMEKLVSAVRRFCDKNIGEKSDNEGVLYHRQVSALGVHGEAHLSTLHNSAIRHFEINDYYGVASLYMKELTRCVLRRGYKVYASYSPTRSDSPNEILLPDIGIYACVCQEECDESATKINMKRFSDAARIAEVRRYYRTAAHARDTLADLAKKQLCIAGEMHANMEKIYVSNMDFENLRKYTDAFIKRIV
jgi:hypothetical protein